MNLTKPRHESNRLLAVISLAALAYLGTLLVIDLTLYPVPVSSRSYYAINAGAALIVLACSVVPRLRVPSRWLFPLAIMLLSVLPVVVADMSLAQSPPQEMTRPESIMLRQMPLLLLGLLLVAYRYRSSWVVVYSLSICTLAVALHLGGERIPPAGSRPIITLQLIQFISFIVVGGAFTWALDRLRSQNVALARAHERLLDHAQALEELTVSRERNRMARELHDTLAHTLSALTVHLETTRAYLDVDSVAAGDLLDTAVDTARSGLDDTRRALRALRASPLQDLGLLLALRQRIDEVTERAGLTARVEIPANLPIMPEAFEQCIYRIAQEALANVANHANASTVRVTMTVGDKIALEIADDGLGFDPDQAIAGHYGLPGMRERATLVGGRLDVQSAPGAGTTITLTIPRAEEDR